MSVTATRPSSDRSTASKRAACRSSTTTSSTTPSPTASRSRARASRTRRWCSARTRSTCSSRLRAEGTSPWYTCAHDEFALVHGRRGRDPPRQARGRADRARCRAQRRGAGQGRAQGRQKMGWMKMRRGHQGCCRRTPPTSSAPRSRAWWCCRPARAISASNAGPRSARMAYPRALGGRLPLERPADRKPIRPRASTRAARRQSIRLSRLRPRRLQLPPRRVLRAHHLEDARRPAAVRTRWTSATSCVH